MYDSMGFTVKRIKNMRDVTFTIDFFFTVVLNNED